MTVTGREVRAEMVDDTEVGSDDDDDDDDDVSTSMAE
jgi:hypothetical protein